MVILYPASVTLGSSELKGVTSVVVNRTSDRLVVEHTDQGPHVGFVDVPKRRVGVTVKRRVEEDEFPAVKPGDSVSLALTTSESAASGRARRVTANVVVTGLTHDVSAQRAVVQTITLVAFSTDGILDPVTESVVSV